MTLIIKTRLEFLNNKYKLYTWIIAYAKIFSGGLQNDNEKRLSKPTPGDIIWHVALQQCYQNVCPLEELYDNLNGFSTLWDNNFVHLPDFETALMDLC